LKVNEANIYSYMTRFTLSLSTSNVTKKIVTITHLAI
jgi:hypothetical protein